MPYEHLRDAGFPEDVVHFRHWNSHSIFFYDPAENVVEYIARHDLENGRKGAFTTDDILYASEIGFIVDDVDETARVLMETLSLPQYRQGSDKFRAIGDEYGLLLVIKRGQKVAFGQGKPRGVFPTEARIRGASKGEYKIPNYPHHIHID